MTTKWASMSTAGRLTLTSELLDLPRSTGEYVIMHELVHLHAPSDGKVFKSFMAAFMTDWEERGKGSGTRSRPIETKGFDSPLSALIKSPSSVALGWGFCYTGFDAESLSGGRENDCTHKSDDHTTHNIMRYYLGVQRYDH